MKAVEFSAFGEPEQVAECREVPEPGPPGPGEALVDVLAFPINPVDLLTLRGEYAVKPSLPARVGSEGVARVSAVGEGVTGLAEGDRVVLMGRENWVERKCIPADELFPVSPSGDVLQLAMLKVNPPTALLMLQNYVDLRRGEWVIQDAANSGVGRCLVELARAQGLRTVNVVRRESAVAPLEALGADVVVVDGPDLAGRVRELTGGADIRLAIDAVAGDMCIRLADCLAEGGVLVNYGLLSGQPCMLRADQTVFRDIALRGFWLVRELGAMSATRRRTLYTDLETRVLEGVLTVPVEATYPLEAIQEALAHASRGGRGGKVLVTPGG